MKYILSACLLGMSLVSEAQLVVGDTPITIMNGTTFTVDGLVLQPTVDITIQNNDLQRSTTTVPVGSGSSIGRVYLFAGPVSFSGKVGFYYEDTELAGNNESSLNLLYSSQPEGSVWMPGGDGAVEVADNYISARVPDVPLVRITAGEASALPVKLIEFTARENGSEKAALLEWKVANETDFKAYAVERSPDAGTFTELALVKATGSSSYHFADTRPLKGTNYYRLKMTDLDGRFTYSSIRVLVFGNASSGPYLYPNPVSGDYVTIEGSELSSGNMTATVVDMSGRTMYSTQPGAHQTKTINISTWKSGIYIVIFGNGTALRFVKP